jgi:hypothetical protein
MTKHLQKLGQHARGVLCDLFFTGGITGAVDSCESDEEPEPTKSGRPFRPQESSERKKA